MVFCVQSALHRCGCRYDVGAVVLNNTLDPSGTLLIYLRDWLVALTCCFRHGCTDCNDLLVIIFTINEGELIL